MLRILLVESIADGISRRRASLMRSSRRLHNVNIQHCYLVHPDDYADSPRPNPTGIPILDEEAEAIAWGNAGSPLRLDNCLARLEEAIVEAQPDVVLLHTGIAFYRNKQTVISALQEVRRRHPTLRIGYQVPADPEVDALLSELSVFSKDDDTKAAEDLVFGG